MLQPVALHQGFTLDSLGRVVYSIPISSVELDTSTPRPFDHFITFANVSNDQVPVISTTVTFFLLTDFALVLQRKFLKKANKKTT